MESPEHLYTPESQPLDVEQVEAVTLELENGDPAMESEFEAMKDSLLQLREEMDELKRTAEAKAVPEAALQDKLKLAIHNLGFGSAVGILGVLYLSEKISADVFHNDVSSALSVTIFTLYSILTAENLKRAVKALPVVLAKVKQNLEERRGKNGVQASPEGAAS